MNWKECINQLVNTQIRKDYERDGEMMLYKTTLVMNILSRYIDVDVDEVREYIDEVLE
jgi:hypothetical protein